MVSLRSLAGWPVVAVLLTSGGCLLVPQSQFTACRRQHDALAQRCRAQQQQLANLSVHGRQIEDRLIAAEDELAALDKRHRLRGRRLDNYLQERDQLYGRIGGDGRLPEGIHDRLAELSRRYPGLYYDERLGVSKLDTDVLFDTGRAELQPAAREMLREFAAIFRAPEAAGVKLVVAGHTDNRRITGDDARDRFPNNWHLSAARALAVADYVRAAGVPESRMAVSAFGRHQPIAANDTPANRRKNRRVEIFAVAEDVPVVGWTETLTGVYR